MSSCVVLVPFSSSSKKHCLLGFLFSLDLPPSLGSLEPPSFEQTPDSLEVLPGTSLTFTSEGKKKQTDSALPLWSPHSCGEDGKPITEGEERRPPQLTGQESFLEEAALGPGKMERRAQMVPGETSRQGLVSAPLTFSLPSPQACLGPCRTPASCNTERLASVMGLEPQKECMFPWSQRCLLS